MKTTNAGDDYVKPTQSKSSKKSTKSRSKSSKSESSTLKVNTSATATSPSIITATTIAAPTVGITSSYVVAPTTPTSSISNSLFDSTPSGSGGHTNVVPSDVQSGSSGSKSHHKNHGMAGFEARSIKIMWEQHDQSDIELSHDVCTRLAEDASYKMWELINNIKIYARHSGGKVTYDLVNEVLRDSDVPPALGALDTPWDRVDYDGSYYFYSDKIVELREEYQKEIQIEIPLGDEFKRSWLIEEKHVDIFRKYIPSIMHVVLHGKLSSFELVIQEVAYSPMIATSYRVILAKIIQILAYKQSDCISLRCWSLLRACAVNPYVQDIDCRKEYFHLAEILICQLIGPLECIKIRSEDTSDETQKPEEDSEMKLEGLHTIKHEQMHAETQNSEILYSDLQEQQQQHHHHQDNDGTQQQQQTLLDGESIFRLQPDEDGSNDADVDLDASTSSAKPVVPIEYSQYFGTPVELQNIEELCWTLGLLAGISGYFQSECIFLINKRLERFFMGRKVSTEKEYNYIGRALRGMIALGEYAFREFIPFIFKFNADHIPESIWNDIALSATFLKGPDDIFLYEWLEYVCGDKLQAFMVYHAEYLEKLHTMRFLQRKQATFRIIPKVSARRLEWSTLAAAMCLGDDPNRALKPKPRLFEVFPDLIEPNLNLNRPGNIRFKFAGCRPVILRPKKKAAGSKSRHRNADYDAYDSPGQEEIVHHDIIIAKRKLYKPLTDERRIVPISSYFYARI